MTNSLFWLRQPSRRQLCMLSVRVWRISPKLCWTSKDLMLPFCFERHGIPTNLFHLAGVPTFHADAATLHETGSGTAVLSVCESHHSEIRSGSGSQVKAMASPSLRSISALIARYAGLYQRFTVSAGSFSRSYSSPSSVLCTSTTL